LEERLVYPFEIPRIFEIDGVEHDGGLGRDGGDVLRDEFGEWFGAARINQFEAANNKIRLAADRNRGTPDRPTVFGAVGIEGRAE
jgi:hypothetical protein